jgi:cytochrome c-type biogenesis protein
MAAKGSAFVAGSGHKLGGLFSMDVSSGLSPLLLAAALGAGLISFISPCVLPLVPAYLGFITGLSADELKEAHGQRRLNVLAQGFLFVLGLALIFAVLGATATVLGQTLLQNLSVVTKVAGAVVIVFGLHMLGVLRMPVLYRTLRISPIAAPTSGGYVGSFMLGLAFGAGWTPCIGPFLTGVLGLAASESTVAEGVVLLLVYALGLGVPFVAAALAVERSMSMVKAIRPWLGKIERASGVVLILMGVLLFTDRFTLITIWLTRVFGTGLAV